VAPAITIEILEEDGRLFGRLAGQPKVALVREIGRSFFMSGLPYQLSFAPGRPAPTLTLHQGANDTQAPRID